MAEDDWMIRDAMFRQNTLGAIVLESSYLERLLRCVFTALIGSKYAAVVSGGQNGGWLVEHCKALAKVHQDIEDEPREKLVAELTRCGSVYQLRNRVVHDAHAARPGERVVTLQSKRHSPDVVVTASPIPPLQALADEIGDAGNDLAKAAEAALGEGCLKLENALRLELGHDVAADVG